MTKCVECGKKKKVPAKRYVSLHHYTDDPYCSRTCCEAARGIKPRPRATYGEAA